MWKKKNKKEYIIGTAIYNAIYVMLFAGLYFMVFAVNGFKQGGNHYSSQISNLFPLSVGTFVCGLLGCIVYAAFVIVNSGIIPLEVILCTWLKRERPWLLNFTLFSCFFLIVEIVFLIVLTEEGVGGLPHKFLFRYFQIFIPPIFVLFIKYKDEMPYFQMYKINIFIWLSLGVVLAYFAYMRGNTRQAIIDGHLFLFVENLTKYILPYADVLITIFAVGIFTVVQWMGHQHPDLMKPIIKIGVAGIMVFWLIEVFQLPYYTNVIAGGKAIQKDSIKIAEFLNEGCYEEIYYVYRNDEERNSYLRNFYGYIKQPYQIISEENIEQIIKEKGEQKVAFLLSANFDEEERLKKIDLDTEKLVLYGK